MTRIHDRLKIKCVVGKGRHIQLTSRLTEDGKWQRLQIESSVKGVKLDEDEKHKLLFPMAAPPEWREAEAVPEGRMSNVELCKTKWKEWRKSLLR